jgi:hypothetical protein
MMNFMLRSPKAVTYDSITWCDSQMIPSVRFAIRKISLANRIELIKRVRELCLRDDFLRAGDTAEQSEAKINDLLVKKLYLEWGLTAIHGLTIDGQEAGVELLINHGPEELSEEIVERIRLELGLTEQERKNS